MRKSVYTHNPPVKVIILDAAKRILESNEMEKMKQKIRQKQLMYRLLNLVLQGNNCLFLLIFLLQQCNIEFYMSF